MVVIKYTTIITDPESYNAAAHEPPDSIYDNKAFLTYKLEGSVSGSTIKTPVVEKAGGYETGLMGKTGEIEAAYHTIKWTLAVNQDGIAAFLSERETHSVSGNVSEKD